MSVLDLQKKIGLPIQDQDGAFGKHTLQAAAAWYKLSRYRAAHFFGQTAHETGGYKAFSENLNYSQAGLRAVFPKYYPTDAAAAAHAHHPDKIANHVYANRMGNGDEASGDGYRYRGRGALQLTGKANYLAYSLYCNRPEIMTNPDLVAGELSFESAMWYFTKHGLWSVCDVGLDKATLTALTKAINGGTNGLDDRIARTLGYAAWL